MDKESKLSVSRLTLWLYQTLLIQVHLDSESKLSLSLLTPLCWSMVDTSLVLFQIQVVILIWLQVMQSGQGQGFPTVADTRSQPVRFLARNDDLCFADWTSQGPSKTSTRT